MESLVEVQSGQVVVDSRSVAHNFGKAHRHVLETIDNITKAESSALAFFKKITYKVKGNFKKYPAYLMNRDGFSLLVMGFTGKKALQWKIKYIEAFNRMEEALKHPTPTRKLPDIPKCKYFRGTPVVTMHDLALVTGISQNMLLYYLGRSTINVPFICGQDMKDYKQENHLDRSPASGMYIMTRDLAVQLLNSCNLYKGKAVQRIDSYFNSAIRGYDRRDVELTIKQLYIIRNTLPYIEGKEAKDLAARFIVQKLMQIDLLRPSDFPGMDLTDMDINSEVGWNTAAIIQNSKHMIEQGIEINRKNLAKYQNELLIKVGAVIARR